MRRTVLTLALLGLATLHAQQPAPGIESIRKEEMKADLFFLASDALEGRLTDTPGNRIAAEWIAARFARLGLVPAGDNGTFFQAFTLMTASRGAENTLRIGAASTAPGGPSQAASGDGLTAAAGQDFYPLRFSAAASASGEVAFVGFGISSPERGYDDYRGDVKGRIVLALDHEPGERDPDSPFDGIVTSQVSDQLWKTLAAQENGAAAILFVRDVHNHPAPVEFARSAAGYWPAQERRIPRYMLGSWVERVRIPAAQISPELAAELVKGSGRTLEELSNASESATGSTPVPLGTTVTIGTSVNRHAIEDRNVVALLEGSDPKLRDELVILCAHYDHDGVNGDNVMNGADDDGSGTVGVLELAEAFVEAARTGHRPRRSILFAAWNSEERGLFGAWAYTEHPLRPLQHTVAVLNLDMIGRNEEVPSPGGSGRFRGLDAQTAESNANAVNIIGTTRSASLEQIVDRANAGVGLTLRLRYDNNASQLMRRSDHWPFLNRGVPAVWIHTGLHPDYHTPNDDAERINYEKMEKIVRLVYEAAWELGNAEGRPVIGQ